MKYCAAEIGRDGIKEGLANSVRELRLYPPGRADH